MLCNKCGTMNDEGQTACAQCGELLVPSAASRPPDPTSIPEAQASAPQAPPNPAAAAPAGDLLIGGYRIATLGDRLIAIILDTLLIAAVFALVGMWTALRWGGLTANGFSLNGTAAGVAVGLTFLFGILYYFLLEGLFGATLGKAVIGIQVRNITGVRCGIGAALVRNLLRIVDGLALYLVGFLIALFSKRRQRLGDHAAKTVVVEKRTGLLLRIAVVIIWLGLIAGGIYEAYRLHQGSGNIPVSQNQSSVSSSAQKDTGAGKVVASGTLQIINFEFLESKDGPFRSGNSYKPGEKIFSRYNIIGYTTNQAGEVNLTIHLQILDPDGVRILEWKGDLSQKIANNEPAKGWFDLDLPLFVPAGNYQVQIKIHDAVKNSDAETNQTFSVNAPPAVVSSRLEMRDVVFSLSENGEAMTAPAMKAGESLYMRAKLAGLKFNGDNINVNVAFQVMGPDKNILLDLPKYLEINSSFTYHPLSFFVPITGNVDIPSDALKGTYKEKYILTDRNANATETQEYQFEVK